MNIAMFIRNIIKLSNIKCDINYLRHFYNFATKCKKIIGVATNYCSVLIMENISYPSNPDLFLKAPSSIITEGNSIIIPKGFKVKEEVELAIIISKAGKFISELNAMRHVAGYCVALDLTAVNKLTECKKLGHPWEIATSFDTSCPVGTFIPKENLVNPHDVKLYIDINHGQQKRCGYTSDFIFNIPTLVQYTSSVMTLEENDIILTGSPPGSLDLQPGDFIHAGISDVSYIQFVVKNKYG